MANKFLNDTGLTYLWTKIKNKILSLRSPIEDSIATVEEAVATTNHGAQTYLMKDGSLYKVISPIASGENLVVETNIHKVDVGSELKSIHDSMELIGFVTRARFNMWDNDNNLSPEGAQIQLMNSSTNSGYILDFTDSQLKLSRRASGVATDAWDVRLKDDTATTSSALSLNGTWQIPSAILSHRLILIMLGRFGRYDTKIISTSDIAASLLNPNDGALTFWDIPSNAWWRISISPAGVIKLVEMTRTDDAPNIIVRGIL